MNLIVPERVDAPSLGLNARGVAGLAVGMVRPPNWQNAKFNGGLLANLETAQSGLVYAAGYNSFMFQGFTSGNSFVVAIGVPDYSDLTTPFPVVSFVNVGTVNATFTQLFAGASTAVLGSAVLPYFYVQIKGTGAIGAADVFLTMTMGVR